jgi:hypothetical protein
MISPNDILVTKTDLTLFSTVLVTSNLVLSQLSGSKLFDESWMNFSVATLLGVALHGLLTNKLSAMANERLNVDNKGIKQSVYDLVKFGTIFASQKAIVDYIEGRQIQFDQKWAMTSGLTIAGYAAFNMIENMVPRVTPDYQPLVNDLIKVSMGALLANFVVDGTINQSHLIGLGATLSGFVAFHLGTKRLVVPQEKFSQVGGHSVLPQ